jgi:hypothetical protein
MAWYQVRHIEGTNQGHDNILDSSVDSTLQSPATIKTWVHPARLSMRSPFRDRIVTCDPEQCFPNWGPWNLHQGSPWYSKYINFFFHSRTTQKIKYACETNHDFVVAKQIQNSPARFAVTKSVWISLQYPICSFGSNFFIFSKNVYSR